MGVGVLFQLQTDCLQQKQTSVQLVRNGTQLKKRFETGTRTLAHIVKITIKHLWNSANSLFRKRIPNELLAELYMRCVFSAFFWKKVCHRSVRLQSIWERENSSSIKSHLSNIVSTETFMSEPKKKPGLNGISALHNSVIMGIKSESTEQSNDSIKFL